MVELADVTKEQVGELVTDDEVALDADGGGGVHDVVAVRADHLEAPQWARAHVGRGEVDRAPSVHGHRFDEAVDRAVGGHQGPDQPEDACGLLQVRRDHWDCRAFMKRRPDRSNRHWEGMSQVRTDDRSPHSWRGLSGRFVTRRGLTVRWCGHR